MIVLLASENNSKHSPTVTRNEINFVVSSLMAQA